LRKFAPKWRLACAVVSLVLVFVYLVRWNLQVDDIYATSPTLGVTRAIERLIQVQTSVFQSNNLKYGLLWAVLAAYWDVLIVPVQIIVAVLLLFYRRTGNEQIAETSS